MDMPRLREVEHRLLLRMKSRLEEQGWAVSAAQPTLLTRNISTDVEFQIRLNSDIAASIDRVRILPALGVRHREISRLTALFFGLPTVPESVTPSAGLNLSDLLPDRSDPFRWAFLPSRSDTVIEELILSDIGLYGIPFLQSVSSLEGIIRFLEERPIGQGRDEVLLVGYAITGNLMAVHELVAVLAMRAAGQRPPLSDQTLAFLVAFKTHFGVEDSVRE